MRACDAKGVHPGVRPILALTVILSLISCAGPALEPEAGSAGPSYASPPAASGVLAEASDWVQLRFGHGQSGFHLLDSNQDALLWRLALIDSAVSSLDIMSYLWYPDLSGGLILERAIQAAQRGVRVRLVLDDLLTTGQDELLASIESNPNIELRLFNPWKKRDLGSRAAEMIVEMERLNSRMHDKMIIADGHAVILGGRNIGDHYFGLNHDYNFHDLDVLAISHLAQDANSMFDHFWNSDWMASAQTLTVTPDPDDMNHAWKDLQTRNRAAPELAAFAGEPRSWTDEITLLLPTLAPGTGHLVYDEVSAETISQTMIQEMNVLFEQAQHELLITNAYIIPGDEAISFLQRLTDRGVDVRILTNSLASHDVPAVNSHYEPWRKPLLGAGVKLYEMRADPDIRTVIDTAPVTAKFSGLHTKAAVIDGQRVFVGSMNLDPRSAAINTEMGAVIDSPDLAEKLRTVMLRDMKPANAWELTLDDDGQVLWRNDRETLSQQPTRDFMQNILNVIFKVVPKEQY